MDIQLQSHRQSTGYWAPIPIARGVKWGLMAGLAATVAMDVALMVGLWAAGLPVFGCYALVGDTVARFFFLLGLEIPGGAPLGIAAHYVIGPVIGAIYGAAWARLEALQTASRRNSFLLAILYVEILSQPLLMMTPILLDLSPAGVVQWYGGSTLMHALAGAVMSVVLRRAA